MAVAGVGGVPAPDSQRRNASHWADDGCPAAGVRCPAPGLTLSGFFTCALYGRGLPWCCLFVRTFFEWAVLCFFVDAFFVIAFFRCALACWWSSETFGPTGAGTSSLMATDTATGTGAAVS